MNRRQWWLIGGAAGILLIAAALWLWPSSSQPPSAEEAAVRYLRALESGDPTTVANTGVDVSAAALHAFEAATGLVEDAEVTAILIDDGSTDDRSAGDRRKASAEISFVLDDAERMATLSLVFVDGRWIVDDSGLGTMTASSTLGRFVAIGEQTFPTQKKTVLLPASYPVGAAPTALLNGQSPLIVLPGDHVELVVEASMRPEATVAAQQQLDDHLTSCTAPASTAAERCGVRIPWGTEFRAVSEFRYRVEQLPVMTLEGTGFRAGGGVLVATVTGTGHDGTERMTTYRNESWSVRGGVSFAADDLVLSVW